tara:strand:+ start:1283 stop:1564 length:282 start_codon:yes stop_codon:yes gene_type:complete
MSRYHATVDGNVAFTAAEEEAHDAEEQAWADGQTDRDWAALRDERDRLIAETDWWAGSDLTMTDAQTTYRQELRDLPANTTDPSNPSWPTKPE